MSFQRKEIRNKSALKLILIHADSTNSSNSGNLNSLFLSVDSKLQISYLFVYEANCFEDFLLYGRKEKEPHDYYKGRNTSPIYTEKKESHFTRVLPYSHITETWK